MAPSTPLLLLLLLLLLAGMLTTALALMVVSAEAGDQGDSSSSSRSSSSSSSSSNYDLREAEVFLQMFEEQALALMPQVKEKAWTYSTNITDFNQQALVKAGLQEALWKQKMARKAAEFKTSDFPPLIQRRFAKIMDIGSAILNDSSKLTQLSTVSTEMEAIYSTAKVCLGDSNCPDALQTIQTSRDEKLLRRVWVGWRNQTGKKMRQLYPQYVSLNNEAVRMLGYPDYGAYWRSWYETESFEQDVAALFEELQPFYKQLHAFVRRRLKKQYGEDVFPASGHIPAHLLGDMWGQTFTHIQDLLVPFPDSPSLDVTPQMVKQNYTARKIFETAEDFFLSLGLEPMPPAFWNKSMLEKPTDGRDVVCHASAWDFYTGDDVRIKDCTRITMSDLRTAHHEMGHVEYYLSYKDQPVEFRTGANPGFHEAVGDTIAISVKTPQHLHKMGLLPFVVDDLESKLNFLMTMALDKIAFLPFGYLIDQWRWSVFRGDTTPDNYNQAWWNLRCNLQGVSPPVKRTEDDFDPGAKYHIASGTPYIRYFVSFVIQFQFHKALCEAAGHQGPLHTCDIYNSTVAGDKLRAMLSKGSSEVWTVPFKALTGTTKMTAKPLIQYFQPLMDVLRWVNGKDIGWTEGCPQPVSSAADDPAHTF